MLSTLYFGFPVSGKSPFLISGKQKRAKKCWVRYILKQSGVNFPRRSKNDTDESLMRRFEEFDKRRDAVLAHYGCMIEEAGYAEHPQYLVTLDFSPRPREAIEPLDLERMHEIANDPESRRKLREFCMALGLEYQEPRWYNLEFYGSLYDY